VLETVAVDPTPGCPGCDRQGVLEVVSGSDSCSWPGYTAGDLAATYIGDRREYGVVLSTGTMYWYQPDAGRWDDLEDSVDSVTVTATEAYFTVADSWPDEYTVETTTRLFFD